MRILCTTHPFPSHLRPLSTVLHAAERRGHEVLVACPASGRQHALALGLAHVPAGHDWWPEGYAQARRLGGELAGELADEERNEAFYLRYFLGRAVTDMAVDVVRLAGSWRPDIIVREEGECGAVLAADLLGVPQVSVATGGGSVRRFGPRRVTPWLREYRAAVGLPPDPEGARVFPHLHACLMPERYDPGEAANGTSRFYRHADPDGAGDAGLPDAGSPFGSGAPDADGLVLASFGTVVSGLSGPDLAVFTSLALDVASALATLGRPAVLSVGTAVDLAAFRDLPSRVTVVAHAPQTSLLRKASVFVSHGGFNSVRESLGAGVPMVLVPLAADQHHNARRCASLGVARHLPRAEAAPGTIASAVTEVGRSAAVRERVRRLREDMARLPPLDALVSDMEELVRLTRGVGGCA